MTEASKDLLYCSFCRRDQHAVRKLIAGPGLTICDACVDACNRILAGKPAPGFRGWDTLSDRQLLRTLRPAAAALGQVESVLREHVRLLRQRDVSWEKIGRALGVSRQAAWERFAPHV